MTTKFVKRLLGAQLRRQNANRVARTVRSDDRLRSARRSSLVRRPALLAAPFLRCGLALQVVVGAPSIVSADSAFERCRAIAESTTRLHCYEEAARQSAPATAVTGDWRLVRTTNPRDGAAEVSVTHTADTSRADLDLAGLMLRCAEKGSAQVLIVVVTPFPPRSRPNVSITAGSQAWHFVATIVPPGAEVLLPPEAEVLAAGPWQSIPELSVRVITEQQSVGGVIPISGISSALQTLATNCPRQ